MGWGLTFTLFTHYPRYGDMRCSLLTTNFHTVPSSRRSPKSNPTHQLPLATTTASIIIPRLLHDYRDSSRPPHVMRLFIQPFRGDTQCTYSFGSACSALECMTVDDRKVNYCFDTCFWLNLNDWIMWTHFLPVMDWGRGKRRWKTDQR